MRHVISILMENEAGALSRVAGLFSARGYNIESLTVAPTEDATLSRLTLVTKGSDEIVEQIVKQLHKLINVIKISELDPRDSLERELLLCTVKATPEVRGQVIELVDLFEGRVLDVGHDEMTLSLDADPSRLDDLEELLRPFGIIDLQRTGRVALARLEHVAP